VGDGDLDDGLLAGVGVGEGFVDLLEVRGQGERGEWREVSVAVGLGLHVVVQQTHDQR